MNTSEGLLLDPGRALWNQRHNVRAALPRLESFLDAILSDGNMVMLPEDYPKIFATVLEFKPDLIIEVGRHFGNTTCILTEAAQSLRDTSVLSICLTNHWHRSTLPKIRPLIAAAWLDKLDARVMDLVKLDIADVFSGKKRIFFLLDAHGWELAEYVIAVILPELVKRDHMLFMHDVVSPAYYAEIYEKYFPDSPTRPADGIGAYGKGGIWNGTEETWDRYLFLNGLAGGNPEFVAFVDFVNRNDLKLHSVEESVRREIEDDQNRREEMRGLLGDKMYSPLSAFAWFSMSGLQHSSALRFPVFEPKSSARANTIEELRNDLKRNTIAGKPSPLTLFRIIAKAVIGRYVEPD